MNQKNLPFALGIVVGSFLTTTAIVVTGLGFSDTGRSCGGQLGPPPDPVRDAFAAGLCIEARVAERAYQLVRTAGGTRTMIELQGKAVKFVQQVEHDLSR